MIARPVTVEDIPAMMEIRLSVRENRASRQALARLGITEDSLAAMIGGSHSAWCVDMNGRLSGFSMANLEKGTVEALFVDPGCEGRGIGRKLLDAAVLDLRNAGHDPISLTTEPGSRAYRFYARNGWIEVGEAERGDVRMELTVTRGT